MTHKHCITTKIKEQLNNLPGKKHQDVMKPSYRGTISTGKKKLNSAVMVIIFYKGDELYTSIIKRSVYNGKHSGQMAFPGGKYQKDDKTLTNTAIRETFEEIGIKIQHSEILGNLTELMIPVSNILVTPIVCFIDYIPQYKINKFEVQQIYNVPIKDFINNKKVKKETQYNKHVYIPYFDIQKQTIWGATAMILSEFIEVLERAV